LTLPMIGKVRSETIRGILLESVRLYWRNLPAFVGAFVLPAMGRLLWMIYQRGITHHRYPDWPQAGIVVNADWGLSIYSPTIYLTYAGMLVYFILAGPALAAVTGMVRDVSGGMCPRLEGPFLVLRRSRAIALQLVCVVCAWGVFAAGLLGTIFVTAPRLGSSTDPGGALLIWYAGLAFTFLVGGPVGIWLSLRYVLAVPTISIERLSPVAALHRSVLLTRGIKARLLAVLALVGGIRWVSGLTAAWFFGLIAHAHPAAATVVTFLLIPLALFVLDMLFGALGGVIVARQYIKRTAPELPQDTGGMTSAGSLLE
jgi:hypothetical protein